MQTIWLISIVLIPVLNFDNDIGLIIMMISSYLGGFGSALYSKASFELMSLSQSRRGKYQALSQMTFYG